MARVQPQIDMSVCERRVKLPNIIKQLTCNELIYFYCLKPTAIATAVIW